jgi:hypothetical protein
LLQYLQWPAGSPSESCRSTLIGLRRAIHYTSAIFFKLKPQTLAAAHFVVDDGWTVLAL